MNISQWRKTGKAMQAKKKKKKKCISKQKYGLQKNMKPKILESIHNAGVSTRVHVLGSSHVKT